MPCPPGWLRRAAASAALLFVASGLSAQDRWSTAYLPPDHWSVRAARRVAALGLAPEGHDALRGGLTQREIGDLFEHAVLVSDSTSAAGRLARGYLRAFTAELAVADSSMPYAAMLARGSSLSGGWARRDGALRPGWGYEDGDYYGDWNDAEPLADESAAFVAGTVQLSPWDRAAVRASGSAGGVDDGLTEAHVTLRFGAAVGWLGRRRLDWSAGPGDGLIVNDRAFDGAGIGTADALWLPGFLRHIGALHGEFVVARVDLVRSCTDPIITPDDSQPCEDAWFAVTRGSVTPHERVQLGVTRGVVFGGEGNTEIDAFALFSILIGKHAGEASELDNQVVAVDASWRLPTERWLPLRAYLEWGFEDSAGAWKSVPGILAGIEVPAVPGVPGLGLALERTSFARSCCGNPIWYRSSVFHDGWVMDERPLGHGLGGHGEEWSLHASWDGFGPRIGVAAQAFVRDRGFENLYAETRTGGSRGGGVRVDATLARWLEAIGTIAVDDGEGWRDTRASVALRAFL